MAARIAPRRHEIGVPASRFIGRQEDLAAIRRLFAEGRRLVTLWGPAGMGKTRLALELARAEAQATPELTTWVCELQEARDHGALCGAVARALGAAVAADRRERGTVARIGQVLAAQGPALLVLDSLEQVMEPAAAALSEWLRAAPDVRFLVTSRERTRLPGEVSYELMALGLAEAATADGGRGPCEAAQLFVDRVNTLRPRDPLGAESAATVSALVTKLEGIPLAIELAAARADVLGLEGLLARLSDRLDLLGGASRGTEARQATMRSAVAWSWDLLDEPDRRALARCSVFRGGFTLAACESVLEAPALERVQSLRDKSLLRARPDARGVRFSLYEAVRQLAGEKLVERGDAEAAERRHAAFYLTEGERQASTWERHGAVEALDRLADDLENLLAVVERALARVPAPGAAEEALRALMVTDPVLATRGPFGIHLELLDRALTAAEGAGADPLLEARALAARGRARKLRGLDAAGLDDLERACERARALGAPRVEASVLTDLGVLHHQRRAMELARAAYERALEIHRAEGDRRAEARVLGNLGALHHDERRFDEAMRHYEPAISIAEVVGDRRTEGIFCGNAALVEQERGRSREARSLYERACAVLEEVGDHRLYAITLGNLGGIDHEDGRLDEAAKSHARAVALLADVGDRRSGAIAHARLGAALAGLDRLRESRDAIDRGERLLAALADPLAVEIVGLMRGFLDVALARAARVGGREAEAEQLLGAARGRIARAVAGAPSLADRSDDIRLAQRMLERSLSAMDASLAPGRELLLAPEARWCRPPESEWHDLRDRHAVRRLLLRLAESQRERPGAGLSLAELQAAGWPGERILPRAASNRIYVTLNQLRALGLKPWLKRGGEGYFLDPALPVHFTSVEPLGG
jgi:predicted ATPase